jgi:hypothetical protein
MRDPHMPCMVWSYAENPRKIIRWIHIFKFQGSFHSEHSALLHSGFQFLRSCTGRWEIFKSDTPLFASKFDGYVQYHFYRRKYPPEANARTP